jgi:hypothetical protein
MVADHQPLSRDVGAERVPAGVSALRELRDRGFVSQDWRHEDWEDGVSKRSIDAFFFRAIR